MEDDIRFVSDKTRKKCTEPSSAKNENDDKSKDPDYNEDEKSDKTSEGKQEQEEISEIGTTTITINQIF